MAEPYILSPRTGKHFPTKKDLELVTAFAYKNRWALGNSLKTLASLEERQETEADEVKGAYLAVKHVSFILEAIRSLGENYNYYSEFCLNSIILEATNFARALWSYQGTKGIDLLEKVVFEEDLKKEIDVKNDDCLIYTQLFQFLENAVQSYLGKGFSQKIIVGAEVVKLGDEELDCLGRNKFVKGGILYTEEDKFVRAYVQDWGKGILEEDLPRIFQDTRKGDKLGGIGLALSEYICDLVHGFIKVESEIREGSTFSLYFAKEYKEKGGS